MDAGDRAAVFPDERQQQIAEYVATRGRARIAELAEHFAVTEQTVRKDLRVLHDRGTLKRTHGGAIARHPLVERELSERQAINASAKQRIARACLELLSDGDAIFLDSGTTIAALARELRSGARGEGPRLRNLSILTNAIDVAREIADVPTFEHVLLGGQVRTQAGAVVGALAAENLQRFTVESAFIGASGFSDAGISVATVAEAQLKAAAIERARRVVVPIDSSKAGVTDFARICSLEDVDVAVMDAASPELEELCRAHGVRLIIAAP